MRSFLLGLSVFFALLRPSAGIRPKSAMTPLDVYADLAHILCGMLLLAGLLPSPPGGKRWPYWVALSVLTGVELAVFFLGGGMN